MAQRFNLTAQLQIQANSSNVNQTVNQIKKQLAPIGNVKLNVQANTKALANANKQIQGFNKGVQNAQKSTAGLNRTLAESARRFSVITVATGTLLSLVNAFKKSLKGAIDFELELVKISQVTGKTVGQLSGLSKEVTKLSTSLGVSSADLLNTSRILLQTGLSATKAKKALDILAKSTLAATFDDIQSTTEGAIAILNQFGAQAARTGKDIEFLEKSLDAINAVSKNFAVESGDLVSAIRRVGGVFANAGGSVEELVALFTSVRATTRESAETIATGLRTIFTRIQRQDTIDQLKELGIVLQDSKGNFVGAFEAVKRLSEGLRGLDPRGFRFSAIVEELGGFRQIGKVIPLINQFETAQRALNVAQSASGSISKDAQTAQQALATELAKTREQFNALIRKFADSSTFRSIATGALKLAQAFIDVAAALEPLLPLITALFAIKAGQGLASGIGILRGLGGAASGVRASRFNRGGPVPGTGNRDTVPAMLTPGEFVIKKSSVKKLGMGTLAAMNANRYQKGGTFKEATQGDKTFTFGIAKDLGLARAATLKRSGDNDGDALFDLGGAFLQPKGIGKRVRAKIQPKEIQAVLSKALGITVGGKGNKNTLKRIAETGKVPELTQGLPLDIQSGSTTLKQAKIFGKNIRNSLSKTAQDFNLSNGLPFGPRRFIAGYRKANPEQIEGNVFEAALAAAGSTPYSDRDKANARIDFPGGLGQKLGNFFGISATVPTDAKRTFNQDAIGSLIRKGGNTYLQNYASEVAKLNVASKKLAGSGNQEQLKLAGIAKKNKGGGISGSDTVPALLTPGEFVFNKSAAQSIGYSNLNRMNKNGVQGYATGGIVGVQRFANGGGASGGSAAGFAGPGNLKQLTAAIATTTRSMQQTQKELDKNNSVLAKVSKEQKLLETKTTQLQVAYGKLEADAVAGSKGSKALTRIRERLFTLENQRVQLEAQGISALRAVIASEEKLAAQTTTRATLIGQAQQAKKAAAPQGGNTGSFSAVDQLAKSSSEAAKSTARAAKASVSFAGKLKAAAVSVGQFAQKASGISSTLLLFSFVGSSLASAAGSALGLSEANEKATNSAVAAATTAVFLASVLLDLAGNLANLGSSASESAETVANAASTESEAFETAANLEAARSALILAAALRQATVAAVGETGASTLSAKADAAEAAASTGSAVADSVEATGSTVATGADLTEAAASKTAAASSMGTAVGFGILAAGIIAAIAAAAFFNAKFKAEAEKLTGSLDDLIERIEEGSGGSAASIAETSAARRGKEEAAGATVLAGVIAVLAIIAATALAAAAGLALLPAAIIGVVAGAIFGFGTFSAALGFSQEAIEKDAAAREAASLALFETAQAAGEARRELEAIEALELSDEDKVKKLNEAKGPDTSKLEGNNQQSIDFIRNAALQSGQSFDKLRASTEEEINKTKGLTKTQKELIKLYNRQLNAGKKFVDEQIKAADEFKNLAFEQEVQAQSGPGGKTFDEVIADQTNAYSKALNREITLRKAASKRLEQELFAEARTLRKRASNARTQAERTSLNRQAGETAGRAQEEAKRRAQLEKDIIDSERKRFTARQKEAALIAAENALRKQQIIELEKSRQALAAVRQLIQGFDLANKAIDDFVANLQGKAVEIQVEDINLSDELSLDEVNNNLDRFDNNIKRLPKDIKKQGEAASRGLRTVRQTAEAARTGFTGAFFDDPDRVRGATADEAAAQAGIDLKQIEKDLGPEAAQAIRTAIDAAIQDGKVTAAEIEKIFKPIVDSGKRYEKEIEQINNLVAAQLKNYQALINQQNAVIEQNIKSLEGFNSVTDKLSQTIAKARGTSTARATAANERINRQTIADAGTKGRGGVRLDANNVTQLKIAKQKAKADLEANRAAIEKARADGASAEALAELQKKNNQLINTVNDANTALKSLADSTGEVDVLLEDLAKERNIRSQQRDVLKEFVVGGTEQRQQLVAAANGIASALATGTTQNQTPEQRQATFGLLDRLSDAQIGISGFTGKELSQELLFRDAVNLGFPPDIARDIAKSSSTEEKILVELEKQTRLQEEAADAAFDINRVPDARFATGGMVQYRANGGSIFKPKGTDTVPAMLTPGEFVIRRSAVNKIGADRLAQLNRGDATVASGGATPRGYNMGGVIYRPDGSDGPEKKKKKKADEPLIIIPQKNEKKEDGFSPGFFSGEFYATSGRPSQPVSGGLGQNAAIQAPAQPIASTASAPVGAANGNVFSYEDSFRTELLAVIQERNLKPYEAKDDEGNAGLFFPPDSPSAKALNVRGFVPYSEFENRQIYPSSFRSIGGEDEFIGLDKEDKKDKEIKPRRAKIGGIVSGDAYEKRVQFVFRDPSNVFKLLNISAREEAQEQQGQRKGERVDAVVQATAKLSQGQFDDAGVTGLLDDVDTAVNFQDAAANVGKKLGEFDPKKGIFTKLPSAKEAAAWRKTAQEEFVKLGYRQPSFSKIVQTIASQSVRGGRAADAAGRRIDKAELQQDLKDLRVLVATGQYDPTKVLGGFVQNRKGILNEFGEITGGIFSSVTDGASYRLDNRIKDLEAASKEYKNMISSISTSKGGTLLDTLEKNIYGTTLRAGIQGVDADVVDLIGKMRAEDLKLRTPKGGDFTVKDYIDAVSEVSEAKTAETKAQAATIGGALGDITTQKEQLKAANEITDGWVSTKNILDGSIKDYTIESFTALLPASFGKEPLKDYLTEPAFTPSRVKAIKQFALNKAINIDKNIAELTGDEQDFAAEDVLPNFLINEVQILSYIQESLRGKLRVLENKFREEQQKVSSEEGIGRVIGRNIGGGGPDPRNKRSQTSRTRLQGSGLYFAQGGNVADTIPAMLTPGEFVMSPEAVQKYGVGYMKSLNRGTVPGFRRGGLIGGRGVAYRANGSSGPESGAGTVISVDPSGLQAVLTEFSASFQEGLDNIIGSFSGLQSSMDNLANVFSQPFQMMHTFSGDMTLAFSIQNGDQLKNSIAEAITPKISEIISGEIDKRLNEFNAGG